MKSQDGELRLFGVQISSPPSASENEALMMRKCLSLGNLQHYSGNLSPLSSGSGTGSSSGFPAPSEHWDADGYGSDGFPSSLPLSRDRKKGVPWSEEEHRLFLIGLQKLGKGDWRGIARNFVRTRTPTQVASHAQKFFLRQTNMNKRRRRSSLFDISFEDCASAASAAKLMRLDLQTPQLSLPASCFNGGKLSLRTGFVSECNDFSVVTTDLLEARARRESLLQPLTIWPESGSPSLRKSQAAGVESCCSTQLSLGDHRLNSFPDHTGV